MKAYLHLCVSLTNTNTGVGLTLITLIDRQALNALLLSSNFAERAFGLVGLASNLLGNYFIYAFDHSKRLRSVEFLIVCSVNWELAPFLERNC